MSSSHSLDRLATTFDDRRLVSSAGLLLPATLAQHLGLQDLLDTAVDLGGRPGHAHVGEKALTLVASALEGGDCIDDANALRAGATQAILGHRVAAPSTLGTFLRSFRSTAVAELDRVSEAALARAWEAGAGPGDRSLTIDVDSTICETYGLAKEGGNAFTYTKVRGYHPLLAVAAGTGDLLHARLRRGPAHTASGAAPFLKETFRRVRSAGSTGQLTLRADSGFYDQNVVRVCREGKVDFSITARLTATLRGRVEAIPESEWEAIPYWLADGADVAETSYVPFAGKHGQLRLIVRRVRPTPGTQLALLANYSYHAFITDRAGETLWVEADHRRHAEVENTIRDLKYGVGLNHLPSGRFWANAAWLALNGIAHNLARWTTRLGLGLPLLATKTLRHRLFRLPGRLTSSARRHSLHLPAAWPWQTDFATALARLRAIPPPLV
jgi:Transposase DDE domain group 1